MLKQLFHALVVTTATTLTACTTAAPTRTDSSDDPALAAAVHAALARDTRCACASLYVESYRGAVQISGIVASPLQKARATTIAAAVQGVRSVTNDVEVAPARAD